MNIRKSFCLWVICSFIFMNALNSHAATVSFTLDDVILQDGQQITGTFEWTYNIGDLDNGVGQFTSLHIPWTTVYNFTDGTLNIDIQTKAIEISGDGNYHDYGLDIKLVFSSPLAPAQPSSIDLGLSFFECCGNGFKDQPFKSGSIAPIISPIAIPPAWWRFATPPYSDR